MKKEYLYILLILLLANCSSDKVTLGNKIIELEGKWGMIEYFDSIKINKKIAPYRVQYPTWFGIVLEIDKDSIFSFGSIYDLKLKMELDGDTLGKINVAQEGTWILLASSKDTIRLMEESEMGKTNPKIYHYTKRSWLDFDRGTLDDAHKLNAFTKELFNNMLFNGSYSLLPDSNKVIFRDKGEIIGLEDFMKFQVNNYFGTLHPFKNQDEISFSNEEKDEYYNWIFKGNKLTLTRFKRATIWSNRVKYPSEYFILGDKKLELIKLK